MHRRIRILFLRIRRVNDRRCFRRHFNNLRQRLNNRRRRALRHGQTDDRRRNRRREYPKRPPRQHHVCREPRAALSASRHDRRFAADSVSTQSDKNRQPSPVCAVRLQTQFLLRRDFRHPIHRIGTTVCPHACGNSRNRHLRRS